LGLINTVAVLFSRVIFGSRIALAVGLVVVAVESVIGVALGLIAGLLWRQDRPNNTIYYRSHLGNAATYNGSCYCNDVRA